MLTWVGASFTARGVEGAVGSAQAASAIAQAMMVRRVAVLRITTSFRKVGLLLSSRDELASPDPRAANCWYAATLGLTGRSVNACFVSWHVAFVSPVRSPNALSTAGGISGGNDGSPAQPNPYQRRLACPSRLAGRPLVIISRRSVLFAPQRNCLVIPRLLTKNKRPALSS